MSVRSSATRYARALFDVALTEADIDQVLRDLTAMADAVASHADLRRALGGTGIPPAARTGVALAIGERMQLAAPVIKLVALLAERGRMALLPEIRTVYGERLLAHKNIVPARVTSAMPLASDSVERLGAKLSAVTGKSVEISPDVDASLIGGIVARIGSTVYDGSVQTQLKRMRERLVEG